jgi:hypothetical protein
LSGTRTTEPALRVLARTMLETVTTLMRPVIGGASRRARGNPKLDLTCLNSSPAVHMGMSAVITPAVVCHTQQQLHKS